MHRADLTYRRRKWTFALGIGSFLALTLLLSGTTTYAQADRAVFGSYALTADSRMWLEGSANVTDYSCKIPDINADISVGNFEKHSGDSTRAHDINAGLKVDVMDIECGKKPMNRDLREALKAEKHPKIHFKLLDARRADPMQMAGLDESKSIDWFDIEVTGKMTIAGTTRKIKVESEGRPVDEHQFRVRGKKKINMEDFDITPPTAMFGLIKADKWLTVHFDFLVGPDSDEVSNTMSLNEEE